jgi:hypothetical protein
MRSETLPEQSACGTDQPPVSVHFVIARTIRLLADFLMSINHPVQCRVSREASQADAATSCNT